MPGWAKLPFDIFSKYDLSCTEACVYAVLLDICDTRKPDPYGYYLTKCRQDYIAQKLGISRRTVVTAIAKLQSVGLIDQDRHGRASEYLVKLVE